MKKIFQIFWFIFLLLLMSEIFDYFDFSNLTKVSIVVGFILFMICIKLEANERRIDCLEENLDEIKEKLWLN